MAGELMEGFRLSPKQEHLWSLGQRDAGTPYVAQCVVIIEGPLDRRALKDSLLKVVEQNEILRTNFRHWQEMNVPIQTISTAQIAWAGDCDLRGLGAREQELELQRLIETSRQTGFDLDHGAVFHAQLVQCSFWEHQLILTVPALCADNQTLGNLVQQLSGYYHDVEQTGAQPLQYADVSQWYNDALESEDAQAGKEYWRNQYVAGADAVALPFEKRAANESDFRPQVYTMKMPDELSRRIATFERSEETPLPILFLSCWQILLWRLTRQAPLQIGVACNGRNYPELEQACGLLTTNVPILSTIETATTSQQIFQRTIAALNEVREWQDLFSWGNGFKSDSSLPFFPVCFEFNERPSESFTNGTRFSIHRQYACIDRFKLKLSCIRANHSYVTELHYDSELFDAESIQCLASRFQTLLAGMLAQPDGAAGTWDILGESERQTLAAYNATARKFPAYQSFQQLFELQVKRTPEALALVCGDEQFSYAQLNAAANHVAHHLLRYGVGAEKRVALCLERSPLMLIALLGVLKTGAAYLPLDVQAPARRLQFILEDAKVLAVITQNKFRGSFPKESEFPIWCLDTEVFPVNGDSPEDPRVVAHPENLAYVIYTSGSTGNPKGVMIENRGLINYLSWAKTAYRMGEGSRTLVHSPFSFDLTITGLLLPLIAGGTVEFVSQGNELERLCDALADPEQHYALIKLTPSHLQVLSSWLGERTRSGRVDALIIGGEALPADLLAVWREQSPETRLINEYGPTETVVGCSTYEVPAAVGNGSIAIGRPLGNMQMYVLDGAMQRVPAGTIGEIYIGGEQVARGYLNQTALTAERFVPDPFSTQRGKRLYRSGDLGRMRADGEMEYLGRTDEQVKIKGFRIELGEVETVLRRHELVRECVVVVHGAGEEKRLLGYVVLGEGNNDRELKQKAREEIKAYLRRELPEYMVPRDIVVLDRMRVTPNGKIDRKALPLPTREAQVESDDEQLSPAARALTRIWCEFLNLERVGVNDNFFALGGDSILAVQIAFKTKQLGFTFHPVQLFRHPTIAQLETVLTASSSAQRV